MKITSKNKRKRAFTLIELLIVIAIIGILFIVLVSKVDFATDKAKTSGVQTDFRSFQVAFEQVSRENAGFNTLGWDTGDVKRADFDTELAGYTYTNALKDAGDRIRNSYDVGDINLNGEMDGAETWVGRSIYTETWTGIYTLDNPADANDVSGYVLLENEINKNLDPKLQITIDPATKKFTMKNGYQDPWTTEYHGFYLTNALADGKDRGAILMYSNGPNKQFGSDQYIANGEVTIVVPKGNIQGADDLSMVSVYTYFNGYGENKTTTSGFSQNQLLAGGSGNNSMIVVPPSEGVGVQYKMLSGAGQIYKQNVDSHLIFRSEAEFSKFVRVEVDGVEVPSSEYTAVSGSTVVMLKTAYLNSLPKGNHVVEIISNDGYATAGFGVDKSSAFNNNVKTNVNVNGHIFETTTCSNLYDLLAGAANVGGWIWSVSEYGWTDADWEYVLVAPNGKVHNLKEVPIESNGVYMFHMPLFGKTLWEYSQSNGYFLEDALASVDYKTVWVDFGQLYSMAFESDRLASIKFPVFAGKNETYQDIVYHSVLRWYRPEPDPRLPAAAPSTNVDNKLWVLHPGYKGFGTTTAYYCAGILKDGILQDLSAISRDGESIRLYFNIFDGSLSVEDAKTEASKICRRYSESMSSIVKYNTAYKYKSFEIVFYKNGGFIAYDSMYGEGYGAVAGSVFIDGTDVYLDGVLIGQLASDGSTFTTDVDGQMCTFTAGIKGTETVQRNRWYVSKDGTQKCFIGNDGTIQMYQGDTLVQTIPGNMLSYEYGTIAVGAEAGYLHPDGNKIIFGELVFFIN